MCRHLVRWGTIVLTLLALGLWPAEPILAQDAAATTAGAASDTADDATAPADEEAAAKQAAESDEPSSVPAAPPVLDRGDTAWMLTSSALVLFMTAPGLAMFYGGLVRKKNVLGVMMQCFFLMGMMSVVWAVVGYTLSFGGSEPFIGTLDYLCLQGVKRVYGQPMELVFGVPRLLHMVYQGMFFIITPALICGAFAERMKFSTMVVFTFLWGLIVYCPLCHWVWGDGGILNYVSPNAQQYGTGALDFAGGAVVHISSGVSALICALVMGKRLGFGSQPMPPHNLTYTAIGAAMLWVGWFGFNAGSAIAADEIAVNAFVATHLAAAAGTIAWAGMEWITRGKPSVLGACSGAVAGLVCITPASGFVQPMWGLVMGLAAGVVCFYACTTLKSMFKYDDSLDAFGVHGIGGTLGAILTGVFATRDVNPIGGDSLLGLLEGGTVLKAQLIATALTWFYAAAVSFVLLKILDVVMGLRVSQQEEVQGLDLSQHGEEGYIFL